MYTNLLQKIDRDIAAQLKTLGVGEKRPEKYQFPCITISREFGCEAIVVSKLLSEKLSSEEYPWVIFHRQLLFDILDQEGIKKDLEAAINSRFRGMIHQYIEQLLTHKPTDVEVYKKMAETIRILCARGRSIIIGSGAAILTSDMQNTLHVRLQADMEFKIGHVSNHLKISRKEARKHIEEQDQQREQFIYNFTHKDVHDPHHYHLVIDNSKFNAEQIVELIYRSLVLRKLLPEV